MLLQKSEFAYEKIYTRFYNNLDHGNKFSTNNIFLRKCSYL